MRRLIVAVVCALGALLGAVACAGAGPKALVLDGSARAADDEGAITEVAQDHLVLDGARRYDLRADLQVFSSSTLRPLELGSRLGTYVQVGLRGGDVRWVACYSAVVAVAGHPPTAFHVGQVRSADPASVRFTDGSVLKLAGGVTPPTAGQRVRADIDVGRHLVTAIAPG